MTTRRPWTRDELLIAFRLYCGTPFGKLDQRNPEIIELARLLGRTPSAVGMKACNFAGLDPAQQARGIRGLSARSKADEQLWAEFETDAESIAAEAEAAWESLAVGAGLRAGPEPVGASAEATRTLPASGSPDAQLSTLPSQLPSGPTEIEQTIRVRRVQRFFRQAVLVSYETRCALTGIAVADLLTAPFWLSTLHSQLSTLPRPRPADIRRRPASRPLPAAENRKPTPTARNVSATDRRNPPAAPGAVRAGRGGTGVASGGGVSAGISQFSRCSASVILGVITFAAGFSRERDHQTH